MSDAGFAQIGRLLAEQVVSMLQTEHPTEPDAQVNTDSTNVQQDLAPVETLDTWLDTLSDPYAAGRQRTISSSSQQIVVLGKSVTWVAIAIQTSTVQIRARDDYNAAPLATQGRQGIFSRMPGVVEDHEVTKAVVIAVTSTQDAATEAVTLYKAQYPETDCVVSGPHTLGEIPTAATVPSTGPAIVPCRVCGDPVGDGTGLCGRCRSNMYKEQQQAAAGIVEEIPTPRVPDGSYRLSPTRLPA